MSLSQAVSPSVVHVDHFDMIRSIPSTDYLSTILTFFSLGMDANLTSIMLDVLTCVAGFLAFQILRGRSGANSFNFRWPSVISASLLSMNSTSMAKKQGGCLSQGTRFSPQSKCAEILNLLPTEFSHAMRLYRQVPKSQLSMDPDFWVQVILACVRVNHSVLAERVFADFASLNVWMPVNCYQRIIRYCFCRRYFTLLLGFWDCPSFPRDNHDCLHTMMKASFECSAPQVWGIVDSLFSLPSFSSRDAVASLRICASKRDYKICYRLYTEVQKRCTFHDDSCLRAILPAMITFDATLAFTLLADVAKQGVIFPGSTIISDAIKSFGSAGRTDLAFEALELKQTDVQGPLVELLEICVKEEDLQLLKSKILSLEPKNLNSQIINLVVKKLLEADLANEAMDVYTFWKRQGQNLPSTITLQSLLKSQCNAGELDNAFTILGDMESNKIQFNSSTFYMLLRACELSPSGQNRVAMAHQVFRDFKDVYGVIPTPLCKLTYDKLVARA